MKRRSPLRICPSTNILKVETDQEIPGIGLGGSRDTPEQRAAVENLWQLMHRGCVCPPSREKRDHIECYSTGFLRNGSPKDCKP